jgi:D-alanyl-D-alanine dipeptidase
VVVSESWKSSRAKLYRFEKINSRWKKVSNPTPVVVGKRGMGVGLGLSDTKRLRGSLKREGDRKAPAGVFYIPFVFTKYNKKFSYPTHKVGKSSICVDDSNSIYYNKIVDKRRVKRDYRSFENMVLKSGLYDYGIFVSHNPNSLPKRGSCIFIHIAKSNGTPTVGCTAMSRRDLISTIKWLKRKKNPLLIQAPKSQIERLLPKGLKL